MKKLYIGKKLKPPFDGPQSVERPNPAKKLPAVLGHKEMLRVLELINRCTDEGQLSRIVARAEDQYDAAHRNAQLPETISVQRWSGTLVHEGIKCGNASCKCAEGELHGPYWYVYRAESYVRSRAAGGGPGVPKTRKTSRGKKKVQRKASGGAGGRQ